MQEKQINWENMRQQLERTAKILEDSFTLNTKDVLEKRKKRYQKEEKNTVEEGQKMVVFQRKFTVYALPIEVLSEIRVIDQLTVIPGISSVIKGIINIRGQLITLHDLAAFNKSKCEIEKTPWALIGYGKASCIAILADDVEGIRSFTEKEIHETPLSLNNRKDCFFGVSSQGIIFLNIEGLLKNPDFFYA